MPRKGPVDQRKLKPDAKYDSILVTQFINRIMRDGKRSIAERTVYDALAIIGGRTQGGDPLSVLKRAVDNVRPQLEVKSRRVGGATYQVPIEVRANRGSTLALRWIHQYALIRREKTMSERLAGELLDASNGIGAAVKRREDTHKMAEANRAFAHYRW
jgi:small subunit ribosomal protein S7